MKRFILFAGEYYYPDAGADGVRGDFDSLQEAEVAGHECVKGPDADWFNVLDTHTGEKHTAGMEL